MTAAAPPRSNLGSMNWADVDDDNLTTQQPQLSQSQQQAGAVNGAVRTVVEYVVNEKGQKVKITRKIRSVVKQTRVNRAVAERRKWQKFGECNGVGPGPEPIVTTPSYERIHLDLRPKKREDEKEENVLEKLQGQSTIVICRNCGETGHWTLKCPKRSQIAVGGLSDSRPSAEISVETSTGDEEERAAQTTVSAKAGKYIPLHMRGDSKAGVSSLQRDDSTTLRVTNLSEDVSEDDLRVLFSRCGHVQRIYLAKDRASGLSRGFAFINFATKREAEHACSTLNGHGYDNLILRVEWAKPREDRD